MTALLQGWAIGRSVTLAFAVGMVLLLVYPLPFGNLLEAALFATALLLLNQEALHARRLQQQLRESELCARAGERRYRELLLNLPVAAYTCLRDQCAGRHYRAQADRAGADCAVHGVVRAQ